MAFQTQDITNTITTIFYENRWFLDDGVTCQYLNSDIGYYVRIEPKTLYPNFWLEKQNKLIDDLIDRQFEVPHSITYQNCNTAILELKWSNRTPNLPNCGVSEECADCHKIIRDFRFFRACSLFFDADSMFRYSHCSIGHSLETIILKLKVPDGFSEWPMDSIVGVSQSMEGMQNNLHSVLYTKRCLTFTFKP